MANKAKNKATEKDQLIQSEAPAHYFTGYWRTPNIVDMLALSPTEYRLYLHYWRVCGEGGKCWQGVRGIAKICKMAIGTVISAKRKLSEAGLIIIEPTMRETRGIKHPAEIITLVDIWQLNYEFCTTKKGELVSKEVTSLVSKEVTKEYPLSKNTPVIISISDDDKKDLEGIYEFINKNFDKRNGYILEEARKLATEYTPAWLLKALERAGDQGKFNIGYVKGILKNWQVNGFDAPLPAPARREKKVIPTHIPGSQGHKLPMLYPDKMVKISLGDALAQSIRKDNGS